MSNALIQSSDLDIGNIAGTFSAFSEQQPIEIIEKLGYASPSSIYHLTDEFSRVHPTFN